MSNTYEGLAQTNNENQTFIGRPHFWAELIAREAAVAVGAVTADFLGANPAGVALVAGGVAIGVLGRTITTESY
jgi:hypothetical protein